MPQGCVEVLPGEDEGIVNLLFSLLFLARFLRFKEQTFNLPFFLDFDQRSKFSVPRRTKNVRTSLIWKYFIKYPASATCRLCGRTFKGFRPHTSIECHLKTRHYCQYLDFTKSREEQRKQLAKDQFGHLFSRFYGMNNYNY